MFPLTRKTTLPEHEIHSILANRRRREALRHLSHVTGRVSVAELAEVVATAETGDSPAPRNVRESVYVSLVQTHLPRLHDLGIIDYDPVARDIGLDADARRSVGLYMDVVTKYGVTWGEYYRGLGVFGLLAVVAALAEMPLATVVDPLLWASFFLAIFAASTLVQLWSSWFRPLLQLRLVRR